MRAGRVVVPVVNRAVSLPIKPNPNQKDIYGSRWYLENFGQQNRNYGGGRRHQPGKFSSMLDKGGVPSDHKTSMKENLGKNNKIRAIAFDFDLITRSIERTKQLEADAQKEGGKFQTTGGNDMNSLSSKKSSSDAVTPNMSFVQSMAKLLNFDLDDGTGNIKKKDVQNTEESEEDILRAISGEVPQKEVKKKQPAIPTFDIRTKYNEKLKKRVQGGLAGIERQKEEVAHTLHKGDAETHLAARANAIAAGGGGSSAAAAWLAATGTGNILRYASIRSIRLALLPTPNSSNPRIARGMNDLVNQLPRVQFDLLLKDAKDRTAKDLIKQVQQYFSNEQDVITPLQTLVVSDRDDYLRAAKEAEMYTCRVRPKNARRGNVTTSHTVSSITEVEEVLNEISGISYNANFELGR